MNEEMIEEKVVTGGGGGGIEQEADPGVAEDAKEPAWMTDMRQAASRQRDITMTAKDILTAYLASGGTYVACDVGHIEKAYKIAALFTDFGEGMWGQTMHDIQAKYQPAPSNIVGLDGQPVS